MQFKQTGLQLLLILLPFTGLTQTTYLPQGAKENILLERLEIKAGTDTVLNFSKARPLPRKNFISRIGRMDTALFASRVDRYNLHTAMLSNIEWATGQRSDYESRKPIWKHFYKTPANLYEVHTEDFF